jgi:hypothetical protein
VLAHDFGLCRMTGRRRRAPGRWLIVGFLAFAVGMRVALLWLPWGWHRIWYPIAVVGFVVAARHAWLWMRWVQSRREDDDAG